MFGHRTTTGTDLTYPGTGPHGPSVRSLSVRPVEEVPFGNKIFLLSELVYRLKFPELKIGSRLLPVYNFSPISSFL